MSDSKAGAFGNLLVMLATVAAVSVAGLQQYRLTQRVASLEAAMSRRPTPAGSPDADDVTARIRRSGQLRPQQGPSLGLSTTRVVVVEFSDFQCPYCAAFASEVFPELKAAYIDSGKVRFLYRHLPLSQTHPQAMIAAVAGSCADEQGAFWRIHDLIFRELQKPAGSKFEPVSLAESVGLDAPQFADCLKLSGKKAVDADANLAAAIGVNATPTFLIGVVDDGGDFIVRSVFEGARPIAQFRAALDPLLNQ